MWRYLSRSITRTLCDAHKVNAVQACGVKHIPLPPSYDDVEFPERVRLRFLEKVPQYPGNMRPPKMMKNLKFMRGPETLHNTLLHKQYGIIALGGGRLRWGHIEMIRLGIIRKLTSDRIFAIWRIDPPWQPVTKKGQGQRMGGGKGAIDHYVTPVKAGRVIVEVGGYCEFEEVKRALKLIVHNLPFKAQAVTHQMLLDKEINEKKLEKENKNPYTFKYIVQNNLGGCHNWISPVDKRWFGKHL
ncbi:CSON003729 protein [Gryllus bimaculatus]|nr:CSON003729 protein [Gryllus bimaculatus]